MTARDDLRERVARELLRFEDDREEWRRCYTWDTCSWVRDRCRANADRILAILPELAPSAELATDVDREALDSRLASLWTEHSIHQQDPQHRDERNGARRAIYQLGYSEGSTSAAARVAELEQRLAAVTTELVESRAEVEQLRGRHDAR
jgi:hypothetical protein